MDVMDLCVVDGRGWLLVRHQPTGRMSIVSAEVVNQYGGRVTLHTGGARYIFRKWDKLKGSKK